MPDFTSLIEGLPPLFALVVMVGLIAYYLNKTTIKHQDKTIQMFERMFIKNEDDSTEARKDFLLALSDFADKTVERLDAILHHVAINTQQLERMEKEKERDKRGGFR